jgi:hypothetical protein
MAEPTSPKSGGGCLSKLLFLILLAAAAGFGVAAFYITQPQDLSDLGGYGPTTRKLPERDMRAVLKNSIERGYRLNLSEAEINQWLERTLAVKQTGALAEDISLDRILVRLEEGRAEVIMVRTVFGKPFTVSMFLQVERMEGPQGIYTEIRPHGGPFHPDFPNPPKGGRFGQLVVPQGFLLLVMPAYQKLAGLFPQEIELAFREMSRIRIEKDQLVLDPREPMGNESVPQTF